MRTLIAMTLLSFVTAACTNSQAASDKTATKPISEPSSKVVLTSEVEWEKLNPARGAMSPQAGTLWGDRKGNVPTGFLAKFVDGFSSPPHIHNATYRAVVISGGIHNDDPDASKMWMPAGSFWTQPKGEVHITAAKGKTNIALVEIDKGPYLVLPIEDAFDSGEKPINVDSSNIVWVNPPNMTSSPNGPKIAYLWGKLNAGQSNGTFIKLPAGFNGKLHSQGSIFRAVVIKGQTQYLGDSIKTLDPGSYFSSKGDTVHKLSSKAGEEVIIYVRTDSEYNIIENKPKN